MYTGWSISKRTWLSITYTHWPADNFVEDVLGDFKFEVAPPYVLYRSKLDEVFP